MQKREQWQPSKFVLSERGLRASRDIAEIARGSRLIADIQAAVYEAALREHASGVLLDLACGKVPLYGVYRDLVKDNVCADWGGTIHKSPYLDHEFDLNEGIPLDDASFDTILLTDVLEHIARPEHVWNEMKRVLRPGGKIIATIPFLYWIHEAPHDYCRYTEHKLRLFCEDTGLEILSLESYGGAPEVVLDIIAKQVTTSKILSAIHLAFARPFLRSRLGRKLSNRSRKNFPLGYTLIARRP